MYYCKSSGVLHLRARIFFQLMRELSSSWQFTINEKKGMFSDPSVKLTPRDVRPHVVLIEVRKKIHLHVETIQSSFLLFYQFLYLQFMSKRLEVIQTHRASVVNLIGQLLHHSLTVGVGPKSDHPQRIHPSVTSCTARFAFLTMAIQVLKSKSIMNGIDRTLLREKIYNTALDYFW